MWGALLRKLSVKHQSEHESALHFQSQENTHQADNHNADVTDTDITLLRTSPNDERVRNLSHCPPAEGRRSSTDEPSSIIWKTERRVEDGVPAHTLDFPFSEKLHNFPLPLSDVDEASETESGENGNRTSGFVDPGKESDKPRKSVSVKVAGFVGWKKASKKVDTRLQDEAQVD